ncbi:class I SAM-dependent methyltransferase [Streptomyces violascens]|uniref:class I SAM-dependent methyltransferase n=1 Tax=Streptomyces violascens TaxID=67381 RepID=UPI0037AF9C8C
MSITPVLPGAQAWNEWYAEGTHGDRIVSETEAETFLSHVAPTKGSRAVDLGCGGGGWSRRLAGWGSRVVGYDYSTVSVTQARNHPAVPDVTFELWDVNSEPIPRELTPGSVDLVTCRLSLAYMDVNRLLVDVGRWLAPWGVFYALTPVVHDDEVQNDPYHHALTFDEFEGLGTAWGSRTSWKVGKKHFGIALSGFTRLGRSKY